MDFWATPHLIPYIWAMEHMTLDCERFLLATRYLEEAMSTGL
jgi:hypothetical protein